MARREHSYRRRRRDGAGPLYHLLTTLVVTVSVAAALTMFFRARNIEITGLERYTEEQVLSAAGIEYGDNLFFLNKYAMRDAIMDALPYVEELRINRGYPDRLIIRVRECGRPMAMVQDGYVWLISGAGKVVDRVAASGTGSYGVITGCKLLAPEVGARIILTEDTADRQDSLLRLLSALDKADMLRQTDSIHMEDQTVLTLEYAGRFRVRLLYDADFDRKLGYLAAFVDSASIQDNMTGVFDLTKDDRNFFQPDD